MHLHSESTSPNRLCHVEDGRYNLILSAQVSSCESKPYPSLKNTARPHCLGGWKQKSNDHCCPFLNPLARAIMVLPESAYSEPKVWTQLPSSRYKDRLQNNNGGQATSTSLFYHAFGMQAYVYEATEYREGRILSRVRHNQERLRCPECSSRRVIRRGCVEREFCSVPTGGKAVVMSLGVQRVLCLNCGVVQQVRPGSAEARRCYTRWFERYVLTLSRRMTILDVSRHLGVSWDIVKEIQNRYLTWCFGQPRLKDIYYLAIDEIAVRKGHQYLTVVLDLNSGAPYFLETARERRASFPFGAV